MNLLEHAEELINEIQNRLEEYERSNEESVERIHNDLEKQKNTAEEQIERINDEIHRQVESSDEEVRRLQSGLEEFHRKVEEQVQKLHDESEEYSHKIEEDVERIQNRIEQSRENAEEQIERIREQIEQNMETAEEQIERLCKQAEEYRENAEERVDRLREQMDEHRNKTESHHSVNSHIETNTRAEEHSITDKTRSLIKRFNTDYNERHAGSTISNTYVLNGVEILKYSGKLLPLNELDEHYPRNEWLQTLINKNISIDNLHDYCRYLNARDMLIRIQKKPDVWTSELFGIPPTENWETYQEAYINQLVDPTKAPHP